MDSLTRIVIAHRISTIKYADRIVYIESGAIRAIGNFKEIVEQVPGFGVDQQLG